MNGTSALLPVLLPFLVAAQTYDPLVIEGARWLNHVVAPFNEHSLVPLEFEEDTVINGETYKIISEYAGYGAMREEDRRVWFMPFDDPGSELDSVPLLLYDFNLQVGDLYTLPLEPWIQAEVITRDSVQLMDGTYRDRWIFAPNQSFLQEWVESIGDPVYVLSSVNPFWETGIWLECYGVNNMALYGSCLFLGEVPPASSTVEPFRVVPGTELGLFILQGPTADVQRMTVYDVNGRQVWWGARQVGTIDLSGHHPGVYTAVVEAPNARTALKLIRP